MASRTLFEPNVFPDGTAVELHSEETFSSGMNWPVGAPVTTATSDGGELVFEGLEPDRRYTAYAKIDGEHRTISFHTKHERIPASIAKNRKLSKARQATITRAQQGAAPGGTTGAPQRPGRGMKYPLPRTHPER